MFIIGTVASQPAHNGHSTVWLLPAAGCCCCCWAAAAAATAWLPRLPRPLRCCDAMRLAAAVWLAVSSVPAWLCLPVLPVLVLRLYDTGR
jgi:hypothetical protein